MPIPNDRVDLKFTLSGFETRYFGALPPVINAEGKGHLQGDRFELLLDKGSIQVPSGGILALSNGRLETRALTAQTVTRHHQRGSDRERESCTRTPRPGSAELRGRRWH